MPKAENLQEKFVDEYLIDLNATQAAIRAGYSIKTARSSASRLLTKDNIIKLLQKRRKAIQKKTEITQEKVIAEYAKIAFLNPADFFDENDKLKSISKLKKAVAAAITGMDISNIGEFETVKKIKFADKKGALDSLAKHLGMFVNKELDLADGIKITVSKE